ncbi:alkaline phosphatase D family protein [Litorilituus sediminis]|uniref:alkaline phosphatase D family protein n=1 Tax=Litorilituus sediminis TaxID=718192 RepID=UPI001476CF01|nr:alkaline phosphatase D family protein [Litorilituus sediminis]
MLADILAGPILRRLTEQQLVLWWVTPYPIRGEFCCYIEEQTVLNVPLTSDNVTSFRVGERAYIHLLDIAIELPAETYIEYDLFLANADLAEQAMLPLATTLPTLCYEGKQRPSFIIQDRINNLLHGSCRNPQHPSQDSLLAGDAKLAQTLNCCEQRPALLMMSGDQIYADHVAGALLYAIHQVIELLGLNSEEFVGCQFENSEQIYQLTEQYFKREDILPRAEIATPWYKPGGSQPIFTSTYAHNHVITFAEAIAMYLLVWSPALWQCVELTGFSVPDNYQKTHQKELAALTNFIDGLDKVQRLLAHVPTYMIFDDHDVTDDWNLTAQWEQAAYQDPLAKRIIGNTLMAYWLCQGWGNDPKRFQGDFWQVANDYQQQPDKANQDAFIEHLLAFSHWQYTLPSSPKLVVLDTRTRRWRSESSLGDPSGLMDWEAMCELQQELIGQDAIILVSPAPIFGVKVIEAIQRVATLLGQPLAVDAENWMAHPGSANTMLNIFKHPKTPKHFVILSGDVHYSFVYDIEIRFRHFSPHIWQITSSGIKNQFPQPAIGILDRLNRLLYGPYSPLNLFTKRRAMRVKARKVAGKGHQRLFDQSGLGYLELNDDGSPSHICDLHVDGTITEFVETTEELLP